MMKTIHVVDGVQGNKIKVVGIATALALLISMCAYSTPVEAARGGSGVGIFSVGVCLLSNACRLNKDSSGFRTTCHVCEKDKKDCSKDCSGYNLKH